MKIKNCTKCNRIFVPTGSKICPACIQGFEEKFDSVRNFLWDNPGSNLADVVETTGVDEDVIRGWIKEGRIESTGLAGVVAATCKRCSTSIQAGTYCQKCTREMAADLQKAAGALHKGASVDKKPGTGMFTNDLRRET